MKRVKKPKPSNRNKFILSSKQMDKLKKQIEFNATREALACFIMGGINLFGWNIDEVDRLAVECIRTHTYLEDGVVSRKELYDIIDKAIEGQVRYK